MTQLDLPYVAGSSTSKSAAKSMECAAPTLKARVLSYITRQGTLGATDEEMQSGIPMAANTQRPRRRELELEGRIENTGKTRSTASGRQAVVWRVTA